MSKAKKQNKNPRVIIKSTQYSIITRVVNFEPTKYSSKTIIVDGKPAVLVKGRIYIEL